MAARLSKDTLVQAEDRLRFRHQCIGSWDIRGSTLQMTQETVKMGGQRGGRYVLDTVLAPSGATDLLLPGFLHLPFFPVAFQHPHPTPNPILPPPHPTPARFLPSLLLTLPSTHHLFSLPPL